jgi:hypothetical protein
MDDIYSEIVEPKKKAGFLQVVEVLYAPRRTFQRVMDAGHAWVYPFIFFSIVFAIVFISQIPNMEQESQDFTLVGISEQSANALMAAFTIIFSVIIAPLVVLIGIYLIPSLIYMFFENFILAGHAYLRQVMNITAFATVPISIGTLLASAITFSTGIQYFSFSPQVFLPESMRTTFLGMWLGVFGLFTIWAIILTIIGLAALYRHNAGRTAAWLIPLYLAVSTLIVFVGALAGRLSSNLMIPQ